MIATTRSRKKVGRNPRPATTELEAAIEAQPEVSAPWLVLGDQLQAYGDPRGELINVQHALETERGAAWARLKIREDELLEKHSAELFGPLVKWPRLRSSRVWWRRGFVHALSTDGFVNSAAHDEFLQHPSARFISHLAGVSLREEGMPVLQSSVDPPFELADLPKFPRLEMLDGELVPTPKPVSSGLRHLVVRRTGRAELSALAKAKFPKLETLTLDQLQPGEVKAAAIAIDALRPRNVELCLDAGFGDDEDFSGLSRVAARITTLGFANLFPLTRLALPKVHTLVVRSAQGDGEEFSALPALPALRRASLFLPSDRIRYLRAFATSPLARQLSELCVYLAKPGAALALTQGNFENLRSLELRFDSTFSAEYLKVDEVLAARCWAGVTSLRLQPAWLDSLRGTPMAKSLEVLRVPLVGVVSDLNFLPKLSKFIIEVDHRLEPATLEKLGALKCEVQLVPAFSSGLLPRRGALEL